MIIKFANSNGWKYIDNVKEVSTCCLQHNPQPDDRVVNWDDMFLGHHSFAEGKFVWEEHSQNELEPNILWICCLMDSGQYKLYYSDLSAYIMSDEGKTIERIN